MSEAVDLLVVGAGPAGIGAATAAAAAGVAVAVVDLEAAPGGQVYRALPREFHVPDPNALGPDHAIGDRLRQEFAQARVRAFFGHRVWSVAPGFRIDAAGPGGTRTFDAKAVVAATGTHERIIPVPGWTLPGVIGLAAATILLKAQQMIPGERCVVAGCGPLVAAVAAGILEGGGRVAAVADLASPADWIGALPRLASRPDLLRRGYGWLKAIRAAGVPILFRHAVAAIEGAGHAEAVTVRPVDRNWRVKDGGARTFSADSVSIGHGLVPRTEISRLLHARHEFRPERGGWIAVRDDRFRTSVAGLYVAGDGAGISGAAAAVVEGRLAGLSAALELGRIGAAEFAAKAAPWRRELAKAERFGHAISRLMTLRPGLLAAVAGDTVVCRCEDVTRAEIEDAVKDGANDVNQVKAWTRCGMGPCQGRMCGEAAAELVAAGAGGRERAGQWTARPPIYPVPMEALVGAFTYDDIPKPPPAPP